MYEGRQLHLEDGGLGEVVDFNPVGVDDVAVGEFNEVGPLTKPCRKQESLPSVTK